jgi:hypothetical protein
MKDINRIKLFGTGAVQPVYCGLLILIPHGLILFWVTIGSLFGIEGKSYVS